MRRLVACALTMSAALSSVAAHADVLSEHVVLALDESTPCRGGPGLQVRAVPLGAAGEGLQLPFGQGGARNFVVPKGYALEITDVEYNVWEPFPTASEVLFSERDYFHIIAENLVSTRQATLASQYIRRVWHAYVDEAADRVNRTDMFDKIEGTQRFSFVSGLLVSDRARVCVDVGDELMNVIRPDSFRLRGRLHKLDASLGDVGGFSGDSGADTLTGEKR